MKKQILLDEQEYNKIVDILATLVKRIDSYVEKENKHRNITDCHIMDSSKCDPFFKEVYGILLYIDDDLKYDITKKLGDKYFDRFSNSVIGEDDTDF